MTGVALPIDFQERATEAANLLKALANPDRLVLLCQLVGGERTVTELGVLAQIEQPSLSQQLGVLRGERLVATRRDGKNVFYRVDSPAALSVLETLYGLFCKEQAPVVARKRPQTAGRVTRRRKEI
jgi:ArsR family transcriptional regulator